MPQSTPVRYFYTFKTALKKVAAFNCLDDRWLPVLMSGADIIRGKGTLHAIPIQLPIHGRQSFEEPIVCIAGLVVRSKGHAGCCEARPLHLGGQVQIWPWHFSGSERNIDVVMSIESDRRGYDGGHARIDRIRGPA